MSSGADALNPRTKEVSRAVTVGGFATNHFSADLFEPEISIVIPTRNSARTLGALLDSIERSSVRPLETIIVDNFSEDGTAALGRAKADVFLQRGPERSSQRNVGASAAAGNCLMFLDSDMELSERVIESCQAKIAKADALCIREIALSGPGYWARVRKAERESYFQSKWFEAPRCLRKHTFNELGGYDESITGLEDMDLQASLIERDFVFGWVDEPILHDERDVSFFGYVRKRAQYGKSDRRFAAKHPESWRVLRSPVARFRSITAYRGRSDTPWSLSLIPGMVATRLAEGAVRLGAARSI